MPRFWLPLLLVSLLVATGAAAEITYEADVRPILKAHCFQCHGERGEAEGRLDLRLRRLIVKGGESGPAIVPGKPTESLLIQRVTSGEMPPDEDKRLSPEEVAVLSRWVGANAPTARDEPASLDADTYFTDEETNWWAFRPVNQPTPPTTTEASTPIDAFMLARLSELGEQQAAGTAFELSAPADRTTLIRRVYLDMLGVPPTPEEVNRFRADARPAAWSRLVDRVLASPRYGERWGRHWLDVAGYADSEGYTDEDRVREHAWRYRDYVIRAFNGDKPYDAFVTEQLAGDELVGWPQETLRPEIVEALAATGFLRMAPDGTAAGGIDQDLARNQTIADTLQIVGATLMGMTIQCAQCHDHRYDPIPQRDYYRLRAVFEPALDWKNWQAPPNRLVSLYSEADKQRRADIEARAKQADARRQERVDFYIARTLEHELLMVADELQEPLRVVFRTKPADRSDAQKKLLEGYTNIANITAGSLYLYDRRRDARAKDLDTRREQKLAEFLARARKAHPSATVTADSLAELDPQAAAVLARYTTAADEVRKFRIRSELQKLADEAQAIRDTIPKEHFLRILSERPGHQPATFVFHRGDHQQPKEQVQPGGLSVLGGREMSGAGNLATGNLATGNLATGDLLTSGRRLQLARYLTSGEHPLVARVFVNRIWAHHFGRGIVSTTGDFGFLGARPTHPQLLDWLAAEFVESGWSVKRLHRLILMSDVYQQSAVGPPELVAADPENNLLGRWPLRRLESETLRDAILATAGKLNTEMYGEPVPVMEDEVGQIVLGKENLDGERKPTKAIPLLGNEFRRSVYVQVRRTRPLGVLESFDVPELAPHCTDRASSNVAPQSLMMMNSDFLLDMSAAMAERLVRERPDQPAEQLRRGWELAYGSPPDEMQLSRAVAFLQTQTNAFAQDKADGINPHRAALASYCQALLGSNRFLYIE